MDNNHTALMTDKDWIDAGKANAWAGKPKIPQKKIRRQQVCTN